MAYEEENTEQVSVDKIVEYISVQLGYIFEASFPTNDMQRTLEQVNNLVQDFKERTNINVDDDSARQNRFAALDAAIRIMPDTKDALAILSAAKDIDNYLSGKAVEDSTTP